MIPHYQDDLVRRQQMERSISRMPMESNVRVGAYRTVRMWRRWTWAILAANAVGWVAMVLIARGLVL